MTRIAIAETELRKILKEALWNTEFSGWSSNASGPAEVNSNVDPSAAESDPINPSYVPQNRMEFGVAVKKLVKNLPDEKMPDLYAALETTIDDNRRKEDEESMKTQATQSGTKQVEEAFRQMIRSTLTEINPLLAEAEGAKFRGPSPFSTPFKRRLKKGEEPGPIVIDDENPLPPVKRIPAGQHGGEYMRRVEKNVGDLRTGLGGGKATTRGAQKVRKTMDTIDSPPDDPDEVPGEKPIGGRGNAYKSTAIGGMHNVDYNTEAGETKPLSFDEMATELGMAPSGAKQAVDKALLKAKWISKLVDYENPNMSDDLDIIVLGAISDYMKKLSKAAVPSSELSKPDDDVVTSADIQLMKDHPAIVEEMPGFREFLHGYIKRAMKSGQKLYNPLSDDDADVEPDADEEPTSSAPAVPSSKPASGPPAAAPARAGKATYKIYPGGKKWGGAPAVARVKNKPYVAGPDTKFKPGEQGEASIEGDKLRVKKVGSDHVQTWEPFDEAKRPVLYLRKRA